MHNFFLYIISVSNNIQFITYAIHMTVSVMLRWFQTILFSSPNIEAIKRRKFIFVQLQTPSISNKRTITATSHRSLFLLTMNIHKIVMQLFMLLAVLVVIIMPSMAAGDQQKFLNHMKQKRITIHLSNDLL